MRCERETKEARPLLEEWREGWRAWGWSPCGDGSALCVFSSDCVRAGVLGTWEEVEVDGSRAGGGAMVGTVVVMGWMGAASAIEISGTTFGEGFGTESSSSITMYLDR